MENTEHTPGSHCPKTAKKNMSTPLILMKLASVLCDSVSRHLGESFFINTLPDLEAGKEAVMRIRATLLISCPGLTSQTNDSRGNFEFVFCYGPAQECRGLNYAVCQILFALMMSILTCSHYHGNVHGAVLGMTLACVGLTRITPGILLGIIT